MLRTTDDDGGATTSARPRAAGRSPRAGAPAGDSAIAELCARRGIKLTGQRRVIARVLSETDDHPDVEELYRRVLSIDGRISIATVYRTVRILEEKGLLRRRDFGGGRARLDMGGSGRRHHFVDVDTGRVANFESVALEELVAGIARDNGLDMISMQLNVYVRRSPQVPAATGPAAGSDRKASMGPLVAPGS